MTKKPTRPAPKTAPKQPPYEWKEGQWDPALTNPIAPENAPLLTEADQPPVRLQPLNLMYITVEIDGIDAGMTDLKVWARQNNLNPVELGFGLRGAVPTPCLQFLFECLSPYRILLGRNLGLDIDDLPQWLQVMIEETADNGD